MGGEASIVSTQELIQRIYAAYDAYTADRMRILEALPGWTLYLARAPGAPAGAAVLHMHDRMASLADGAVDPAFRGRGLYRALISRRIEDAVAAGAQWVWTQAAFMSQSYRNMLRAGFELLGTPAIWTDRP